MDTMASQITNITIVFSTFYSGADQRKHQSSASLAFVRGIHWWPVNTPHKWPVTLNFFSFDDVIMKIACESGSAYLGEANFVLIGHNRKPTSPVTKFSFMTMSSNGNIFRVTGHLCGEFTGHRWIARTKASDAELWCFLCSAPEQTIE